MVVKLLNIIKCYCKMSDPLVSVTRTLQYPTTNPPGVERNENTECIISSSCFDSILVGREMQ